MSSFILTIVCILGQSLKITCIFLRIIEHFADWGPLWSTFGLLIGDITAQTHNNFHLTAWDWADNWLLPHWNYDPDIPHDSGVYEQITQVSESDGWITPRFIYPLRILELRRKIKMWRRDSTDKSVIRFFILGNCSGCEDVSARCSFSSDFGFWNATG